jgi:hypothetical protein
MIKLKGLNDEYLDTVRITNTYEHTVIVVADYKCVGYVSVKPEEIDKDMDLNKVHYKISRKMNDRLNIGFKFPLIFLPKGIIAKLEVEEKELKCEELKSIVESVENWNFLAEYREPIKKQTSLYSMKHLIPVDVTAKTLFAKQLAKDIELQYLLAENITETEYGFLYEKKKPWIFYDLRPSQHIRKLKDQRIIDVIYNCINDKDPLKRTFFYQDKKTEAIFGLLVYSENKRNRRIIDDFVMFNFKEVYSIFNNTPIFCTRLLETNYDELNWAYQYNTHIYESYTKYCLQLKKKGFIVKVNPDRKHIIDYFKVKKTLDEKDIINDES